MMEQTVKNITIPNIFKPLFVDNYSRREQEKFTDAYKSELRRRILKGETVSLNDVGVKTFVLHGGRNSGKTKNDEFSTVPLFFGSRGDIWYCRSEQVDIRKSIFQSMQSTIFSMGFSLSEHSGADFKISKSPFEITCNATGNKCQFLAINGDINRTKGYEPPSGKLKKVILEEANEPDGKIYVEALRSTAIRFLDENSKYVYRYNPPPSLNHWANQYFPKLVREQGAIEINPTWRDIADLLEPAQIADILQMKINDPIHYAYWYEGELMNLEGRVVWAFDRERHLIRVSEIQRKINKDIFYQPVYMFYGVDSGLKNDATAVSSWALYPDGRLIKLSTKKIDVKQYMRVTGARGLSHTEQAVMLMEYHEEFKRKMRDYGIIIPDSKAERYCFDGAGLTQDLMLEVEKLTPAKCVAVTNKDVERDLARLNTGWRSGKFLMLDVDDNEPSVIEMENFVRNEEGEIEEGQEDHTVDADKYATYEYYYNFI